MNEKERNALLTACSFAKEFMDRADIELQAHAMVASGSLLNIEEFPKRRQEAAIQLKAALESLEDV